MGMSDPRRAHLLDDIPNHIAIIRRTFREHGNEVVDRKGGSSLIVNGVWEPHLRTAQKHSVVLAHETPYPRLIYHFSTSHLLFILFCLSLLSTQEEQLH